MKEWEVGEAGTEVVRIESDDFIFRGSLESWSHWKQGSDWSGLYFRTMNSISLDNGF